MSNNFKISYKFLLEDNDVDGVVKITSTWCAGEICLACNRGNVSCALEGEAKNKSGIYVLYNDVNEVYVGQTNCMDRRTNEHMDEDFWTRCIFFFNEREEDGFNRLELNFLEARFIKKFLEIPSWKVLNDKKGNSNFGKFDDERATQSLENFKNILTLLGLLKEKYASACSQETKDTIIKQSGNGVSEQKTIKKRISKNSLNGPLKNIKDKYSFCTNVKYSKYSESKKSYWFLFGQECLKEDLDLCLIDESKKEIHIFRIPANTFCISEEIKKGCLHVRSGGVAHGGQIDIKFRQFPNKLEFVNHIDFSPFYSGSFKY